MEPLAVALVVLASIGLGLVAAYVTLSILLTVMERTVTITAPTLVERRGATPVYVSVGPNEALTSSATAA